MGHVDSPNSEQALAKHPQANTRWLLYPVGLDLPMASARMS